MEVQLEEDAEDARSRVILGKRKRKLNIEEKNEKEALKTGRKCVTSFLF